MPVVYGFAVLALTLQHMWLYHNRLLLRAVIAVTETFFFFLAIALNVVAWKLCIQMWQQMTWF